MGWEVEILTEFDSTAGRCARLNELVRRFDGAVPKLRFQRAQVHHTSCGRPFMRYDAKAKDVGREAALAGMLETFQSEEESDKLILRVEFAAPRRRRNGDPDAPPEELEIEDYAIMTELILHGKVTTDVYASRNPPLNFSYYAGDHKRYDPDIYWADAEFNRKALLAEVRALVTLGEWPFARYAGSDGIMEPPRNRLLYYPDCRQFGRDLGLTDLDLTCEDVELATVLAGDCCYTACERGAIVSAAGFTRGPDLSGFYEAMAHVARDKAS